jgi:hypothetical protein
MSPGSDWASQLCGPSTTGDRRSADANRPSQIQDRTMTIFLATLAIAAAAVAILAKKRRR